jgi:iron(III) transport system permease protein
MVHGRIGVPRAETMALIAVTILVGALTVVPLGHLLFRSFSEQGNPTLGHFQNAYSGYGIASMVSTSVVFALGSTAVALITGTILAFIVVRTDVPFRQLLGPIALIPLLIPGVLHTIAWILLAGPRGGWLNQIFEPAFGPETVNIFGMSGMIFVEGLHLSPLAFLLMGASFRTVDPSLEEAALISGARWPTVLRRVTLPPLRPGLIAAVLILGVRGLESFEVPALLGIPDGLWVFSSRIWRSLSGLVPRWGEAGALATSLLMLTSVGVFAHARLTSRGRAFQMMRGRSYRPHRIPLGRWRGPALGFVLAYAAVAVVLPLSILLYASLQQFYTPPSMDGLTSMTLSNYTSLLSDDDTIRAFRHSLVLGLSAATTVVLLGAVVAWFVIRGRMRGSWLLDDLSFLPLAIPGLVLGAALVFVYLRSPLAVYGTLWLLFIAYLTRYMPYGVRYASVSMFQIGSELEEAARTSGATWWQAFRRIVLPLILPGMTAGWIYVLALSIRELSSSILLYAPGGEVISVRIWALYQSGQFTELAALGMLLVALVLALGAVSMRLSSRLGVTEA